MVDNQEKLENNIEEQPEESLSPGQTSLIEEITLPIIVQLGEVKMSIKEIAQLQIEQVIELHKDPAAPVELYVEGKLLGRGELVDIEGELGVKIIELL